MDKKIALLFSGQGSQYIGMGNDFFNHPDCIEVYKNLNKINPNLLDLIKNGDKSSLDDTVNAQPCIMATSLAAAYILKKHNIIPQATAGFSLGEVSAAVFSGLLDLKSGFEFVNHRANYMAESAQKNKGSMAAVIGKNNDEVKVICEKFGIYPVNFNCPSQVTVAGEEEKIDFLIKNAAGLNIRAIKLAVSGAFHSPLMNEAAEKMKEYLESVTLNNPKIPLYSNYTARLYGEDKKTPLSKQINNPVLWQDIIEDMIAKGINIFIETGPGKTLCGFVKKINKDAAVYSAENENAILEVINALS